MSGAHAVSPGWWLRPLLVSGLVLWSAAAFALDRVELSLGRLESGDWRMQDAVLAIDWSQPEKTGVTVDVRSLEIAGRRIQAIRLVCPDAEVDALDIRCRRALFSLRSDALSARSVPASLHYHFPTRELNISVNGLPVAGGKLRVTFRHSEGRWRLEGDLADIGVQELAKLLAQRVPAGLTYQGKIQGSFALRGSQAGLTRSSWQLQLEEGAYSNAEGSQAAEALKLVSRGSAEHRRNDWRVKASLSVQGGMLYTEPLYLEFSDSRRLDLSADLRWINASGELSIGSLSFTQPGVVDGRLSGRVVPAADRPLRKLSVALDEAMFPGLYNTWLQPWLVGGALDQLDTAGELQGHLELSDGRLDRVQMQLNGVSLRDRNEQFGIGGLNGDLHWDRQAVGESKLSWQDASVYRLAFGAAQLALETRADGVKLLAPLSVPLFDGELHVEAFELGLLQDQLHWLLDANLTPVSMRAVSTALGWPPFAGKLSGMIPKVRFENGDLTLGGVLLVQAFDGDITIRNLHVRDALGRVPRLWADARVDNLDLKPLTEAFSFGRIEGSLGGHVDGLYLEAWQPVAFDAAFATPEDDDRRHRISQRAVDNISNLGGGGVAGAVSRSFLRFLEDFPYRRLGIACRLENGICHMHGVADAENGYYLVQGSLLPPRLDVIGYASEVDWTSLLSRLKAVTAGDGPVVR
ncbi:MAG: hypothetical protein ACWGNB_03635 [Thiogranum sp.]